MAERILITGGAGFLGSALASRLCGRQEVMILDSLRRNSLRCRGLLGRAGVRLVRGDVTDRECVFTASEGCRRVVHMASVAGVSAVEADPEGTVRTAVVGTASLLEACRKLPGLKRVVILSSSEVYGPRAEDSGEDAVAVPDETAGPRWSYAAGKLAAEQLGFYYRSRFGLPVTVVRPFNVYGPAQMGEGAVHTFVDRALSGEPLQVHNGGRQVRAWCYVDDMITGLLLALREEAAVGRVFNLGNPDQAVTIRELAEMVVRLSGTGSRIEESFRPGPDVEIRRPDISRARRLLGFAPAVGLEEGLRRTVEWYRREAADG
jgi:nucleoside-diphosphate-sugar epimerase